MSAEDFLTSWHRTRFEDKAKVLFGVSLFVCSITWLLYGIFGTEYQAGKVTAVRWAWVIETQRWDKAHYSDTTWSHPPLCWSNDCEGTYNQSSWTEHWTTEEPVYDDEGNFVRNETEHHWETHYRYDHDEWWSDQVYKSFGTDKHPIPPKPDLSVFHGSARSSKNRRVSAVHRTHETDVSCADGETRTYTTTNQALWDPWDIGDVCEVELNGFGHVRGLAPISSRTQQ